MNLDELLNDRQAELARALRVERLGPACLPFAELGAAILTPHAADHVDSCPRCSTLRARLLTSGQMSTSQLAAVETLALEECATPRRWRILSVLGPIASVACLGAAFILWSGRPSGIEPCVRLQTLVFESRRDVDRALNLLGTRARDDGTVERLQAHNAALRAEVQSLVERFEVLLQEVRQEPAQ